LKSHIQRPKKFAWRQALPAVLALLMGSGLSAQSAAGDATAIAGTVCLACHGADGNSVIPMFPKIAGLQESYIVKQLRDFQAGRRKSDVMTPVVAALKAEDFSALAAFYNGQVPKPVEGADTKAASLGKLLYFDGNEETGVPACVGCHQPQGLGHLNYPRIGGQHVQYVTQQLKNFASGERSNDANRFMRTIAKRMSEEEIDAVAAYLATLSAH
jgi:cytochrome c553